MTPADRNLMCQDADPQAVAQLLLSTYFSADITEWSSNGLHLENRYDSQEPVAVRLISSLSIHLVPSNLVKMTAISPNKIANIAVLCNHSIILHSDLNIIIPPYKTRIPVSNVNTERFYQKLFKMRPRNARIHGAGFKCPCISPEEEVIACSVSDYGDICVIHESGDVAILDHVEFIPGKPYTYFFTSPFSMLSHREEPEVQLDPYVVAYDCCFPPDSDNYLQCDSTLIVIRAIGRHTELKLERCVYSCTPCTIDDLALRGGVRRNWTLRQMPIITFQVTFDPTMPLSISCSISPFGEFAVIVYSGLHFSIPILHVSNSVRHIRQPVWSWSPPDHHVGVYQRRLTCAPHNCKGCASNLSKPEPEHRSDSLPNVSDVPKKATVAENHPSNEPVPIPCRCNCLQFMPSFDRYFSNVLNSYIRWIETDNGSYVMTHNLHAIIKSYMPHSLRSCPSEPARISWSLDGSIYCMSYAGLFIFGAIFGVLFRIELKNVTSAAVCSGPIISFAASSNSIIGKDIAFEFLDGRLLAFRFAHTLTIFQIVLPFNKLGIEYPERWDPSSHTIAACQLIREISLVSSVSTRANPETGINNAVSLKFMSQINAISFLSYGLRDYKLLKQLLLSSSPLEAKELQEGLGDELNPNQSSDNMRELGIATDILLFFQTLGAQVSTATKNMFDLIATLADYQSTIDYGSHLAKIASGAYTATGNHACEAILVPLNILRRRYTKDLSPISLVAAEQIYMTVVDAITSAFGGNILSFFYKQLTNYSLLFSSRASKSSDGSKESSDSDIFTGESDDAEDASKPDNSIENAFRYTKVVCFMAISLLKLTTLFVRTSYTLSAARASLFAQSQPHQLPYRSNGLIGYTIPASTCLSLACGYCCLAYDSCTYRALCCEEKDPAHREFMQKAALFLLCIHALARCMQLYFLDSVAIQMLSILVPQNHTGSSGSINKPQNIAVPLLPFYIINMHYPSIESFSPLQSSSLSLERRFTGTSETGRSHFISESTICLYNYLFANTSLSNIDAPNSPYSRLYLQSVLNMLKEYKPFQYQSAICRTNSQRHLASLKGCSIPTHTQILCAAYIAGQNGCFLAVVSYLLKLSGDTNYCGSSSNSFSTTVQAAPSLGYLTELQCSVLTRVLTICDAVKDRSPLAHTDVDFLLSLRARADTALLDSLVYFLLYVTLYNMLPDFNYFLTYQRNIYTEPKCHCGPSPTMHLGSFGIAGRIRYSLTFSDTAYIDNLPPIIKPLFTPLCIALFLLATGRVEDGVFILVKDKYYSTAIHLLRSFLTSFSIISKNAQETTNCSQNLSIIDQSPVDADEKRRTMNIYSCKISNLERLCSELETNQGALGRIYGPERDSVKEIDYSITFAKDSEVPSSRLSEPPSRPASKQPRKSMTRSHSNSVEIKTPPSKVDYFPEIDDFHINKNPEIGEVLSTSAVKEDDTTSNKHSTPKVDISFSINENRRSSISSDRPQHTGLPPPPPLPPTSIPLSRNPQQPPPLPPPPGSVVVPASMAAPIPVPTQAPASAPPYPFQPRPASAGVPPPMYRRDNIPNQPPPNPGYFSAHGANMPVQRRFPAPAPVYNFQPQPSRSSSNHSLQRPLSVLATSQIRPGSARLPVAPGPYIPSLPVHMPVVNTPGYPGNQLITFRPHVPGGQPTTAPLQLFNGNLLNHPAMNIAPPFQVPVPFQQQAQQRAPLVQQQATPIRAPAKQQLQQQPQKSVQLQNFESEPHKQKQKRMQPQIQSIEVSTMEGGSTLSINDPYPPQQPSGRQMCSNLDIDEYTPPLFSPAAFDSAVDLGTQDYRNIAQYLHPAAPKQPDAPAKRSRPHNDISWMDISRNIEEIDQLTAAAQGTMEYLQALTREVEGNEQRLLRAKH